MSRRTRRVAEQIRSEVARILRQEASDPRLELLTLTRVSVSADLAQATLHWSYLDPAGERSAEQIAEALEKAAPFVRSRLAELLPLRRTPALRFRHDESLEKGDRTLAVLQELRTERETKESTRERDGDGEE
ncbi:MAG: 30S ribosome-binding factor RbfA [Myxococcota bacterium]